MSIAEIIVLAGKFEQKAITDEKILEHLSSIIYLANEAKSCIHDPERFIDYLSDISDDFDKLMAHANTLNDEILK